MNVIITIIMPLTKPLSKMLNKKVLNFFHLYADF